MSRSLPTDSPETTWSPPPPHGGFAGVITFRPGADVESAIRTLQDLARRVTSLFNGVEPHKRLDDWQAWTVRAIRRLRAILTEHEVRSVVLGPRFGSMFSMGRCTRSARTVTAAIDTELQVGIGDLDIWAKEPKGEW